MFSKQLFLFIFSVLLFNSCNVFKKADGNAKNNLPVINLDTVQAFAKTPEPEIYQGSATRINDIIHTKLDVSFDWAKQYMYGKATITIKPYFYPTSALMLDARGMEIKEIDLIQTEYIKTGMDNKKNPTGNYEATVSKTITKKVLNYKYENDVIAIQLDKEYKNDEEYIIYIEYVSKPNELKKHGGSTAITDDKGLYFINPEGKEKDKPQQIWTQGETQSNSVWMPTIDHPNERMTQEIYITVDNKYTTLSNGELCSSFDNGDGTRTDYWKMELPSAPYLAMMAIGEFAVVKDNKWRGKEVNYYVEKEYEPYAKAIFGNTPEMLEFFSNKLGVEFAWNKYSQVVVRDYVSGAMENTSATLHGEFLQRTDRELVDRTNEDVISHELFHQWFGDLVTCESWSNIPLNESFATYGEYLWQEYKYGRDAADDHSAESREGYLSESTRKQVNLIRFHYDDREDMFDAHSYNKGGQILHMLRKYVGDDAFFASLKLYLESNKFTSVEVHNLRLAFEKTTGEDLNWFFNEWFLSSGHPDLVIKTEYDAATKKQKIEIKQVQDFSKSPLFRIPMYVDLYFGKTVERKKIDIRKADETFEFDAATQPDLVNVDAEKMLLCTKSENKSVKELAFQYDHAPLFLDRYEAMNGFAKTGNDTTITRVIISALGDKFWYLRNEAIGSLKNVSAGHEKQIKDKLVVLAKGDNNSNVRASALDYLSSNYKDEDLLATYRNGMNDKSYSVLGSALAGIAKSNPEEAMKLAKPYENEKSVDVLFAIADLYANYGSDEKNEFYINNAEKFTSFSKIGFVTLYSSFLKKGKKDATVNQGVALLETLARDSSASKWINYYSKKAIRDLATMYKDNYDFLSQKLKTQKEANLNAATTELETQIENAKTQSQKIGDIYNSIK